MSLFQCWTCNYSVAAFTVAGLLVDGLTDIPNKQRQHLRGTCSKDWRPCAGWVSDHWPLIKQAVYRGSIWKAYPWLYRAMINIPLIIPYRAVKNTLDYTGTMKRCPTGMVKKIQLIIPGYYPPAQLTEAGSHVALKIKCLSWLIYLNWFLISDVLLNVIALVCWLQLSL